MNDSQTQPPPSAKEIAKELSTTDKARAKYYEFYTGNKWGEKSQFDLCINTAVVGIKGAAEIIIAFLNLS